MSMDGVLRHVDLAFQRIWHSFETGNLDGIVLFDVVVIVALLLAAVLLAKGLYRLVYPKTERENRLMRGLMTGSGGPVRRRDV